MAQHRGIAAETGDQCLVHSLAVGGLGLLWAIFPRLLDLPTPATSSPNLTVCHMHAVSIHFKINNIH